MDHFSYRNRVLHCEDVPVRKLAETYGTPLYVYSKATLLHHLSELQKAFAAVDPLICYSIKTNGNLHICKLMAEHGSGFDVTSGGELYRALKAGGRGEKIVFAGVGKTEAEQRTALENNVFLFNVESEDELHALADVAKHVGVAAPVALRVNPDLPPKTHAKTDTSVKGVKFGLDIDTVRGGNRAGGAEGEVQARPGAGPLHRRQRRHPAQPRPLHQGDRRQALRHPGRRHERSHSSDAVRQLPPHLAGRTRGGAARAPGG